VLSHLCQFLFCEPRGHDVAPHRNRRAQQDRHHEEGDVDVRKPKQHQK
jgi:hypothetical protein